MMSFYICPKWKYGKVKFEVDWDNARLAIREDFPTTGSGRGARFSPEWLSFDKINQYLRQGLRGSGSLQDCFEGPDSVNNSTMLCAVLFSLGCIDREYKTLALLNPPMEAAYDQKNPPLP